MYNIAKIKCNYNTAKNVIKMSPVLLQVLTLHAQSLLKIEYLLELEGEERRGTEVGM